MNIKKILLLICSLACCSFLFSATFIVDITGSGDFTQIQEAVNASTHGDIIIVKPGTYSAFTANRNNFLIQGSGADQTFIFNTSGTNNGIAVQLTGSNIVFEGFTVSSSFGAGISTLNTSPSHIRNCVVKDCMTDGVQLNRTSGTSTTHITNSIFIQNQNGVRRVGSSCEAFINNSIVINNTSNDFSGTGITTFYSCSFNNGTNNIMDMTNTESFIANPMFVDINSSDFNLQNGSPCIDAGHTSPLHNDFDGSRNDMGIYGGPFAYPGQGAKITNFIVTPNNVTADQTISIIGTAKTR